MIGRQAEVGTAFAAYAASDHLRMPEAAAFFWGTLGNALEMDDVDKRALLHPGPTIIPAALAMAANTAATDDALLDAIVRGYEAVIRLGRAVGPGHYALWHNTGTCGSFGASAACASLMGMDARDMAHALALGVSQSAGFWQTRHEPQSHGKQLHTAHAARAGVTAAMLAGAGARGPLSILDGHQGFFAATCPGASPSAVLADYGPGWRIHDVSLKPWPACRHAHPAIDAALLANNAGVTVGDVASIEVATYKDALVFCDRSAPDSVNGAKFSLQHSVAVAIARGAPTLRDFEMAAVIDPALAAIRLRVTVRVSPKLDAAYPAHFGAHLTVHDCFGKTGVFEVPDALGDPENPLTEEAIIKKARTLMEAAGVNVDQCAAGVSAALEHPTDVPVWLSVVLA